MSKRRGASGSPKKKAAADPPRTQVRRAKRSDLPAIYACQLAAYPASSGAALCTERQIGLQLETFPEGQFVALRNGDVIGYAASLIVQLEEDSPWYSYTEITGGGTFSTHDPSGDTLYGADIAVHPDHRGQGVAQELYKARKRLLKRLNLRRMVAGGRIPGYADHAGTMTAEQYVEKVVAGELKDQALNAHLKAGYSVRDVHMGYMRDAQSLNYATFLEMPNPEHRAQRRRIAGSPVRRTARKVRVCAAQYEMRRVTSWDEFRHQVQFFVETAEDYHCHYLLFPEFFTVQLFSLFDPELSGPEAIGQLADLTGRYRELFTGMAERSGLHIIAGSHPVRTDAGEIRNVAHLFTPTGGVYTQEKLHVTPTEHKEYGIARGEGLRIFDTPFARIAILVCYDVEFPELARLLTLAGVEVLFVPFSTDERKSYLRIQYTGHARAVENVIYVVLAGNVGNLPQVDNFLINYGHANVFTPSDFMFPPDATAGKAEFNTETVVICDLDLGALELAREMGSVRLLRDRRPDLYTLESRMPIETVSTT